MFLPYRAKNPPERFPYATLTLIVINVLVFLLTIDSSFTIREDVLNQFGVSHNTLSFPRLFTALFLHENIMHIAGNMLFFWIFGASLEGRIGWWRFLFLYFFAGLAGGLLHDLMLGAGKPDLWSLGASGAIMGLAGAYLYLFPYSTICIFVCFFSMFYRRFGVVEWQARWVVLLYIGIDVLEAWIFGGADGVGHFAHIGGFAMGLLSVWLLGAPRDCEDYSNAQATRAETRDLTLLPVYELDALMQKPNPEPLVVLTYCEKALVAPGYGEQKVLGVLQHHMTALIDHSDPAGLANVLLQLTMPSGRTLPTVMFLRLGSRLERMHSIDEAIRLYYRMGELFPTSPDFEVALFRLGRIAEQVYLDQNMARSFYGEMLKLFPQGSMAPEAQRALAMMQSSGTGPQSAQMLQS